MRNTAIFYVGRMQDFLLFNNVENILISGLYRDKQIYTMYSDYTVLVLFIHLLQY